ncbi:MAG: Cys-tRNA(Pro) deacylase [Cellulosilyticum sp.]|nr:Cys-tRNA(Pro) deacylase [Cellulosilyticum sp.]
MAQPKTNVMRLLEQAKIPYEVSHYEVKDGKIDGQAVAEKIGKSSEQVFKTLVAVGKSKANYVFVIPVDMELDLKKAGQIAGEKSIEMLHVKDLQKITGYIRGGCSPIGMKKAFSTFIDESAKSLEMMTVSGGKIGVQVTLSPIALCDYIKGQFADLTKVQS